MSAVAAIPLNPTLVWLAMKQHNLATDDETLEAVSLTFRSSFTITFDASD